MDCLCFLVKVDEYIIRFQVSVHNSSSIEQVKHLGHSLHEVGHQAKVVSKQVVERGVLDKVYALAFVEFACRKAGEEGLVGLTFDVEEAFVHGLAVADFVHEPEVPLVLCYVEELADVVEARCACCPLLYAILDLYFNTG